MSMRYRGGFISATLPTVTSSSASGSWTLAQQMQYVAANTWPTPPVPMWSAAVTGQNSSNYMRAGGLPAVASNGDVIFSGAYNVPNNFYVYRLNGLTGAAIWRKKLSGITTNGEQSAPSVVTDANNNCFVAGRIDTGNYFWGFAITKLNSSGTSTANAVFRTNQSNSTTVVPKLAIDTSGNVYAICGVQLQNGGSSQYILYVFKFDNNLNLTWQRGYELSSSGYSGAIPTGLAVDTSGNVYVCGNSNIAGFYNFIFKLNSSGSVVSAINIAGFTSNSSICISGSNLYATNGNNAIIGVFDLSLNLVSAYSITGASNFVVKPGATVGNVLISTTNAIAEMTSAGSIVVQNFYANGFQPSAYSGLAEQNNAAVAAGSSYLISQPTGNSGYWSVSNAVYVMPASVFSGTALYEGNTSAPIITGSISASSTTLSVSTATWPSSTRSMTASGSGFSVADDSSLTFSYNTYNYLNTKTSIAYTTAGTYTWVAPAGVTSVSAVAVGSGGGGTAGGGGGGGGLGYRNNIAVTPGSSYTVVVGAGGVATRSPNGSVSGNPSYVTGWNVQGNGSSNATGGTYTGGGGGNGGNSSGICGAAGGGAGGYSGTGGTGGVRNSGSGTAGAGGGGGGGRGSSFSSSCFGEYLSGAGVGGSVGLIGTGPNGVGGSGGFTCGSPGSGGGLYGYNGAGGGAGGYCYPYGCPITYYFGTSGRCGAVRIMWPGNTRSFPSTNTKDMQ